MTNLATEVLGISISLGTPSASVWHSLLRKQDSHSQFYSRSVPLHIVCVALEHNILPQRHIPLRYTCSKFPLSSDPTLFLSV